VKRRRGGAVSACRCIQFWPQWGRGRARGAGEAAGWRGREREVRWAGGVFVGRKKSGRERESKSGPEACCGCGLKEGKREGGLG
jgi:hypothetical protein